MMRKMLKRMNKKQAVRQRNFTIKNIIMKKILVPCDFSKPAIDAFRYALDLAEGTRGTIHLLNVIELPVMPDPMMMPGLNFEGALLEELREKIKKKYERLIDKYKPNVRVVSRLEFGVTSRIIIDYAVAQSADLIVMGSHGASGFREFVIGSNAEKIVRRSPVPVLVVKQYLKRQVKNIVFPNTLDIQKQDELVQKVKNLQEFFKAKLHVLFINTPLNFTADNISHERLQAFANRYKLKNYTLNIFNHTDEEEGINQFTQKLKADIIAIGTHGRKGIAHLLSGSLTEDVVNHSDALVWTYSLKPSLKG